jgi:hypothetical protein
MPILEVGSGLNFQVYLVRTRKPHGLEIYSEVSGNQYVIFTRTKMKI